MAHKSLEIDQMLKYFVETSERLLNICTFFFYFSNSLLIKWFDYYGNHERSNYSI